MIKNLAQISFPSLRLIFSDKLLADDEIIIGYYSLSAYSVSRDELPDNIKVGGYHNIPFLLLGRLAVDKIYQGQGYGDTLIVHAFKTTMEVAEKVGILGIIVDAKDEKAAFFTKVLDLKNYRGRRTVLYYQLLQ